jgi:serine protease Do
MSQIDEILPENTFEEPPRPNTPPVRSGFLIVLFVLVCLAALVYGGPIVAWRIGHSYESGRAAAAMATLKSIKSEEGELNKVSALFRLAQQAVSPAVANIRAVGDDQSPDGLVRPNAAGMGSGVVIDAANGYVVTNHHVVRDSKRVFVRIGRSGELPARIVGADPKTDLAVLQVKTKFGMQAEWGDSESMDIGDWVLAIGSPFALESTVTAGIISAKNRNNLGIVGDGAFEDFLQTDAPINPGNSGGPLVNLQGQVVGINTAIFSENGGNQGIGLSIPSRLAKRIVEQLIKDGKVTRGFFGIQIQSLDEAMARDFGVADGKGALVALVLPGSPAAAAGLKSGDVITKLGDLSVTDSAKLRVQIASLDVGSTVAVEYVREGKPQKTSVTVGDLSVASVVPLQEMGLEVIERPIDPNRPDSPMIVLVDKVARNSPAAMSGLREGMAIVQIFRTPVRSLAEFHETIAQFNAMQGIPLGVKTPEGNDMVILLRAAAGGP